MQTNTVQVSEVENVSEAVLETISTNPQTHHQQYSHICTHVAVQQYIPLPLYYYAIAILFACHIVFTCITQLVELYKPLG